MSSWNDAERCKFEGDVTYEVWRSGGDPDLIDHDRVADAYYERRDYEEAAWSELRSQRRHKQCDEPSEQEARRDD